MNNEDLVVFSVVVHITRQDLLDFINTLNKWEIEDGEEPLTIEEVMSKPDLLKYLCDEGVAGNAVFDSTDCWNGGFWGEWRQFR